MFSFRTRSILQLTVLGFLMVTALLISALFLSARQLELLTNLGQATVNESSAAMRASRQLIEHTSSLERSARQFLILRDPNLLDVYDARRTDLYQAVERLRQLGVDEELLERLSHLQETEEAAYLELNSATSQSSFEYPQLLEVAYEVSSMTSTWVDGRASLLSARTDASSRDLNIRTFLLVCIAMLLVMLFVTLITRPLRQLDRAIADLGSGRYEEPIEIGGPRDLQEVGARLDWLRDRLRRLEQQRHDFLRHVSHELKTPLAAMHESAALLGDGIAGPVNEEQRTLIRILSNNVQRLLSLIEGLLRHNDDSFSVVDARPVTIRLNKLIRDVVQSQHLAMTNADIQVRYSLTRLAILGDPERVRVILDNLLSNAVKFSPDQSTIHISLKRQGNVAVIDVRDEGPGIPPDERDKIFSAFFRGSHQAREHHHSTGLGLAIASDYATEAGGSLTLVDSAIGAHFRLTLPRRGTTQDAQTHSQD